MPEHEQVETTTPEAAVEVETPEVEGEDGKYKSIARDQEKKYKAAARERDALQAKLDEIEKAQLSEVERAKREADEAKAALEAAQAQARAAEVAALKVSIAAAKGLPTDAVQFLNGDDEEAVTASADALLAIAKGGATQDLGQGKRGNGSLTPMTDLEKTLRGKLGILT